MPPPANLFSVELFDCFFSSLLAICFFSRKVIENLQFAVQIEIFPKNTFLPTTTYSGLGSSDHPCMKILFLVGYFGISVIYSEKHFEVRRSPPKIM